MDTVQLSREIFRKAAMEAANALRVENRPLRPNVYVENQRSLVAVVRTEDRRSGIAEALRLIGGIVSAIENLEEGLSLITPIHIMLLIQELVKRQDLEPKKKTVVETVESYLEYP